MDIEFFYLAILDRFTKRDKFSPGRMDTRDSVAMMSGIHSVDLFSHCQNTVFSPVYCYVREEGAGCCWKMRMERKMRLYSYKVSFQLLNYSKSAAGDLFSKNTQNLIISGELCLLKK